MRRGDALELHPQPIEKEGKTEFVVLPYEEYQALVELMNDYEDLMDLRQAKEAAARGEKGLALKKAITELGLK